MSTDAARTARAQYVQIGEGLYSRVFRRAGSRWVFQLFRPERFELDGATLERENAYLRDVFASMPGLIPEQRLFAPAAAGQTQLDGAGEPGRRGVADAVMAKRFVAVDPHRNLRVVTSRQLGPRTVRQLEQFVAIMRDLLADPVGQAVPGTRFSAVPDIIDPPLTNLAVDIDGDLRLLDTNRLISSKALAQCLDEGVHLDVDRRWIHALLLRRLMFLEARHLGRDRASLRRDPLYRAYLSPSDLAGLFAAAAEVREPVEPGPRR